VLTSCGDTMGHCCSISAPSHFRQFMEPSASCGSPRSTIRWCPRPKPTLFVSLTIRAECLLMSPQYIGVAVEVINEGLPRAAYKVIGDKSRRTRVQRIGISNAMILFQICLGLFMSVIICAAAKNFTESFVPIEVRGESVKYVRIGAFSAVFSALDVSVSVATRTLDRYDNAASEWELGIYTDRLHCVLKDQMCPWSSRASKPPPTSSSTCYSSARIG
jgi:hypothetical protein